MRADVMGDFHEPKGAICTDELGMANFYLAQADADEGCPGEWTAGMTHIEIFPFTVIFAGFEAPPRPQSHSTHCDD
jgi:hypothetical protein